MPVLTSVRRALAGVALSVAALTACGMPGGHTGGSTMTGAEGYDAEANLRARPSFEEARHWYLAAVRDWADRISAMAPGLTWHVKEDSWGGCSGAYADTAGVHAYIYVVFSGPIPDGVWPRALDVVQRGAEELGATGITTPVDRPGDHHVAITGDGGVTVEVGTSAAGVLAAKSDCRLRQADLPSGTRGP